MKWRFGYNQAWSFENLTAEERRYAQACGCEPERTYFGNPKSCRAAARCPICEVSFLHGRQCRHVVFRYDPEECIYPFIDPWFLDYFWKVWFPVNYEGLDEQRVIVIQLTDWSDLPGPANLGDIDGLTAVDDWDGDRGTQWGIADDDLLLRMMG